MIANKITKSTIETLAIEKLEKLGYHYGVIPVCYSNQMHMMRY